MAIATIVNGRPTRPDVDQLMKVFGSVPRDGRVIAHGKIEEVIREQRGSYRYRTVITAWRKRMVRESGVFLDGRRAIGEGFVVLKAPEMVNLGAKELESGIRKIRRGAEAVGLAPDDELDQIGQLKRDHVALHLSTVMQSLLGARKALTALPDRPASLPTRSTP